MTFVRREEDWSATRRRCARCRVWKLHSEYDPKRGICKECRRVVWRWRYRFKSIEELDRDAERANKTARRRNKMAVESRFAEARNAIRILEGRGLSQYKIQELTGVSRLAQREIKRGDTKYVQTTTVERLYEGVNKLLGVKQ